MDEQRFDALTRLLVTSGNRRNVLATVAGVFATLFGVRAADAGRLQKTAICHLDSATGTYKPLQIITFALPGHLKHGDVVPGKYSPDDWKACGPSCTNCLDHFTAQGLELHWYEVWCNGNDCDIQCSGNGEVLQCPANALYPDGFNGCAQCCEGNDCAERFNGVLLPPENSYWICRDDYQCDIACDGMLNRCEYQYGKYTWYYCAECCEAADCPPLDHAFANCLDIEIAGGIHPGACEYLCDFGYEMCDVNPYAETCCPICTESAPLQVCADDFIGCGNCCTAEDCSGDLPAHAFWTCQDALSFEGNAVRYCRPACPESYKTCVGPTKWVEACCPPVEHGTVGCEWVEPSAPMACTVICDPGYEQCEDPDTGAAACCLLQTCADGFILCPVGTVAAECIPDPGPGCPSGYAYCVDGSGNPLCCLDDSTSDCASGTYPCPCGLGGCCSAGPS